MTLIITELSKFGITMAADTAVTMQISGVTRVLVGVRKLQPIEKLNAGISIWGHGMIAGLHSDI